MLTEPPASGGDESPVTVKSRSGVAAGGAGGVEQAEHTVASGRERDRLGLVLAALGYVGLTIFSYPTAVAHLRDRYLADSGDGASFIWSYRMLPDAIRQLDNPFESALLFHPVGVNLAFHTNTPLEAVLISLLSATGIGFPLAVNLVILAAVALTGVATYLLALHQSGSRWFSFVAGAAFLLLPWRYGRAFGHHNLVHTWLLPLGLYALLRLIDRPSRVKGVALGAVVGAALLTDITFFLFLLLALSVVGAFHLRVLRQRGGVRQLVIGAIISVVVALPVAVPMLQALASGELEPLPGWGAADTSSVDLVAWLVPPPWHPLLGSQAVPFNGHIFRGGETLGYLGVLLLGGLAGAWLAARRRQWHWPALAAIAGVLAMGPFLQVYGNSGSLFELLGRRFIVPLPYMILHYVPVLNGLRIPSRFSVLVALACAVLAATALARLTASRPRLVPGLAIVVLAVVVVDFYPNRAYAPQTSVAVPAAYRAVRDSPGDRAVLEVPIQWRDGFGQIGGPDDNTIVLKYAAFHRKPVVNGMVARYPKVRLQRLMAIPVYRQMLALQGDPGFADAAEFTVTDLTELGIGYVVYHRDRPQEDVLDYVEGLGLPVLADDGTTVVFEVPF